MHGTGIEILLKCEYYLLQAICNAPAACCQETRGVQAEISVTRYAAKLVTYYWFAATVGG
jgi:hypothetical protein